MLDRLELTAFILLADLDVARGHADRAVARLRDPMARFLASAGEYDDGLTLRNYATALMEAGDLDEADSVFREAAPLTRRAYGTAAFVLHDVASLLARRRRIDEAARVSAYAECVYAPVGRTPRPIAQRNETELCLLLSTHRSAKALAQLDEEGRALTDERACGLAFACSATDG